jgi:hypothetical protein
LKMSVEKLDPDGRYFGRTVSLAVISLTPEEVGRRTNVRFTHAVEDLGDCEFAFFKTTSDVVTGMRWYTAETALPIDMYVDFLAPHPQGWNALARALLQEIGLTGPEAAVMDNDGPGVAARSSSVRPDAARAVDSKTERLTLRPIRRRISTHWVVRPSCRRIPSRRTGAGIALPVTMWLVGTSAVSISVERTDKGGQ